MKIRNGFVSNSSSSSFVIIGVKRTDEDEDLAEGMESLYVEAGEYDYITGVVLSDGEELDESTTSFAEFQKIAQKVADFLKVDINEVELISGCRPC